MSQQDFGDDPEVPAAYNIDLPPGPIGEPAIPEGYEGLATGSDGGEDAYGDGDDGEEEIDVIEETHRILEALEHAIDFVENDILNSCDVDGPSPVGTAAMPTSLDCDIRTTIVFTPTVPSVPIPAIDGRSIVRFVGIPTGLMLESGHFLGSVGEGQIHVLITFLPAGPANCAAFNAAAAGGPGIATTSLAIAVRAGATGFGPTDLLAAAGSPPPRSAGVMVKVTPDAMLVFPVGGMTWAITAS